MNNRFFVSILFVISFSAAIFSQTIPFESSWRFKPGDDSTYSRSDYDDAAWELI